MDTALILLSHVLDSSAYFILLFHKKCVQWGGMNVSWQEQYKHTRTRLEHVAAAVASMKSDGHVDKWLRVFFKYLIRQREITLTKHILY